jgi:hypothetical protein
MSHPMIHPTMYPFTSKYNLIKNNKYKNFRPDVKDSKLPPLKKYFRPYFSPKFNSWEMDYFSSGLFDDEGRSKLFRVYLIFININTKFIIVFPMKLKENPDSNFTLFCFKELEKRFTVDSIRGDDDVVFSGALLQHLKTNQINYFFSGSPYTNKNRVVDRAIRTIRDGVGLDRELLLLPHVVQDVVDYYNNTPHKAYMNKFTPTQVQNDKELESWFIREQQMRLTDVLKLQNLKFGNYEPGNVLLIHITRQKTRKMFEKRRRNFDNLAIFHRYVHGNVMVEPLNENLQPGKHYIIIPIFHTQLASKSLNNLPLQYKKLFNRDSE